MPERVLLVQAAGPPHPGGTNVVLRRLLAPGPGRPVTAVVDRALRSRVRAGDPLALDADYRFVVKLPPVPPIATPVHVANVAMACVAGARAALAARRVRSTCVVSSLDGGFSQIAATVAARLARLPLVLLVFDLWEENAYAPIERRLARVAERRVLTAADAVVVFCEEAADHYAAKHGIEAEVLRIPQEEPTGPADLAGVEAEAPERSSVDPPPRSADGPVDVFVGGAIYWAQEDAVRRLCAAARALDDVRVTVLGDAGDLVRRGVDADRCEPRLSGEGFRDRLQAADVLFLGLSFDSPHPDIVRTATPARLVEYMASGRPLLVHAPGDSHVARYARDADFAEVVSEPSPEALAAGLRRVVDDPMRSAARAQRAREAVAANHDAGRARAGLDALLDRVASARQPTPGDRRS